MTDNRFVGAASALVAFGYLLIGATHFALPVTQLGTSATLFASLAHDGAGMFRLHYWAFALTSLLAMALVLGYRPEGSGESSVVLETARMWALLGFGVTALEFLYVQQRATTISRHWDDLDTSARSALIALGSGRLDPTWFLGFGIVGLWPVVLGLTALKTRAWPAVVAWLGFGVGLAGACVCIGSLSGIFMFINAAAALGGLLLNPLWFGALAIHHLRRVPKVAAA
jgi:hypothetical protein